ncbi:T9SS type A sorting domain-containing protein [Candidatus Poribacteria bacterium]|nr:T9SS type A sorting domain-containing protein [Candidatus Poribacteria bacterium]
MKWQKIREWIVKYAIHGCALRIRVSFVWMVSILSLSLASAQGFTLEQEKLLEGIFSPDGNLLAVKTVAGFIVFDTSSLRPIQTLSIQGPIPKSLHSKVDKLAFSPDNCYLAWSEGRPENVGVLELSTFTQVAYFRLNAFDITDLLFVPGGELLAVQEMDYVSVGTPNPGTVHFWKVGTWEKHGVWGSPSSIGSLAFTHDGKRFVASTTCGPVGEWVYEQFVVDVEKLKPIASRQIQEDIIAYSPDGRFEVVPVNGGNRGLLIRDPKNHNPIANLSDPVAGYILFHSISTDGKWLATYNLQNQVILWDTQTWEIEHRLKLPDGQTIAKGFVKESYWYADVAPTEELRIWDLIKGELLASSSNWAVSVQPKKLKWVTWGMLKSDTLLTSYPNPATSGAWIPFALNETAEVEIRIYDAAGNLVRMLQLGTKSPGVYRGKEQSAYWDGKNSSGESVGSGVYSYEMRTGKNTFVRKAVLLK